MPFCRQCGTELNPNGAFCPMCGNPANTTAPPVRPQAPLSRQESSFSENLLGPIMLAALFFITIVLGIILTRGMLIRAIRVNLLYQLLSMAGIAMAAAVSARGKGPDLSIGAVLGLSGLLIVLLEARGSLILGILLSLVVCAVIGGLNGVLVSFAKVPAIIATLAVGALITGIHLEACQGMTLPTGVTRMALPVILMLLVLGAVMLMIYLLRNKKQGTAAAVGCLLVYVASAVLAWSAGFVLLARIQSASPIAGEGWEMFVLFAYLGVTSCKKLDNSLWAIPYALAPALTWVIITTVMSMLGWSIFLQNMAGAVIVMAFAVVKFLVIDRKKASSDQSAGMAA